MDKESPKPDANLLPRFYRNSTPIIWKEVELKDCVTGRDETTDDHDDTPLLRKLLIFVKCVWTKGNFVTPPSSPDLLTLFRP